MATEHAIQEITRDGLESVPVAADAEALPDGNTCVNDGKRTFLHIINADGSDHTVTLSTTETVDGEAIADKDVVITAGEERFIGPFPTAIYSATLRFSFEAVTSVTVAALRLASG